MKIPTIDERSTFFATDSSEGQPFDTLLDAIKAANTIPKEERDRHARIITESGSTYGWDAITALAADINR
ncbi:hypothetical protein [Arvimicrobium flavum]|uniref:hypothetical protein n=1 Tax=Arvimicrobium flavum TaxID=3393320 RepID=UPI00237C03B7|nr:hypothetical protein [Mesorhizobium shangrilense]